MKTVVCFGDSITRALLVSASYIEPLEERLGDHFHFVNLGVNNDLTHNLLVRMDDLVKEEPDIVFVLIGTNDVTFSTSVWGGLYVIPRKRLPRWPSLKWAYANLRTIIRRIKDETGAVVAVGSIPVLGEDLKSKPMERVRHYNAEVKKIAGQENAHYIPVFESMEAYLREHETGSGRPFNGSVRLMLRLMVRRLIFRESFETFSARQGFYLLTDGVHMNRTGAGLIAAELEKYLRAHHSLD
ncbi:MAG TPA: SGNH/GDSL hydrolase family protein [Anaerolineaceae bacterium]